MDFMRLKKGFFIEGKIGYQAGGPPNIEQLVMVQKKKLKKKRNYGIPSHVSGVLFNQ